MEQRRRMVTSWQIGDIAYIPKFPLSFYSKVGNTDFWRVGIIIDLQGEWAILFYDNEIQKVRLGVIQKLQSENISC